MYSGLPRSVTRPPLDIARARSAARPASIVGAPGPAPGCARRARSGSRRAPSRTDPPSPRPTTSAVPGRAGGRPGPPWSPAGSQGSPHRTPYAAPVARTAPRVAGHARATAGGTRREPRNLELEARPLDHVRERELHGDVHVLATAARGQRLAVTEGVTEPVIHRAGRGVA